LDTANTFILKFGRIAEVPQYLHILYSNKIELAARAHCWTGK